VGVGVGEMGEVGEVGVGEKLAGHRRGPA